MKSFLFTLVSVLLLSQSVLSFSPSSGLIKPSFVIRNSEIDRFSTSQTTRMNMMGPDEITAISSSALNADLLPTGVFDGARDAIFAIAKEGGPPIMALAVFLSDTIPLVPTQPISLVAGALFGLKMGLPAVLIGQTVATLFAILFGRYVLAESDWNVFDQAGDEGEDKSKLAKVLDELTSGLNSGDAKTVFLSIFLARQSPVLPFSLGNYFVGAATNAPIAPAVAGTVLGCLPLNLVWVGAGAGGMAAVDAVKENGVLAEGLEGFGALVTLAFVAFVVKTVMKVYADEDTEASTP